MGQKLFRLQVGVADPYYNLLIYYLNM